MDHINQRFQKSLSKEQIKIFYEWKEWYVSEQSIFWKKNLWRTIIDIINKETDSDFSEDNENFIY